MKINRTVLFLFFVLITIAACTKISETQIGTGLIPPVDGVITKDTNFAIYAKNWNAVDTGRPTLSEDHALGYMNDPVFGTTTAAVNVQMQPTSFPFTYGVSGDSLTLDSVVLALAYRGVWGDSLTPLSLHVKEISNAQEFIFDSTYIIYNTYSEIAANNELTYNGAANVLPQKLDDSFHVYQDSGMNMLRIRLTDEFGNKLLHQFDSSKEYKSDSAFRVAFRGFQISADAVGNALLRIGLSSSSSSATAEANTKLAIYYKQKRSGTTDTSRVSYFTVGSTSAHSNYIKRNLTAGQAGNYFPPHSNASKNDDYIYIQATPGTKALLTVDSSALVNLPNVIVHRAEIIMEQAPDPASPILDSYIGPYLFLLAKSNDTTLINIPGFDAQDPATADAQFSQGSLLNYSDFGGFPSFKNNAEGQRITYYNFNVARYVQGIVTNKNMPYTFVLYTPYKESFPLINGSTTNYGRVSSTPPNSVGIGRVRLHSGTDSTNINDPHRMKLHIVYSVPH